MKSFRNKVREIVNNALDNLITLEEGQEINYSHPMWVILMGIEHEKIHLETTSCLIRQLPTRVIKKSEKSIFYTREVKSGRSLEEALAIPANYIEIPATDISLGRTHTGFSRRGENSIAMYGWDNEFGTH